MKISRRQKIALQILRFMPRRGISKLTGAAAKTPIPKVLRSALLKQAGKTLKINLEETSAPLHAYKNFNAFFTRKLKDGSRYIDASDDVLISPCDGFLAMFGTIEDGKLFQAKGKSFSLAKLVGDEPLAKKFENGYFATVYLTPRHYHRVHSPSEGKITSAKIIPGTLFPVYPAAAHKIENLYSRNERLAIHIENGERNYCVVMVGASNVGSITAAFDPKIKTNVAFGRFRGKTHVYEEPISVEAGAEIATFNLGSTVILLASESGLESLLEEGTVVRLGQAIARRRSAVKAEEK